MFVACGIWCLADVSSVSPSSEQTARSYECVLEQNWLLTTNTNLREIKSVI